MNTRHLLLAGAVVIFGAQGIARASYEAFRLDRIAIVRFTEFGDGRLRQDLGSLHIDQTIRWGASFAVDRPANFPEWALGHNLVHVEAWAAYRRLGGNALDNFTLLGGGVKIPFGDAWYVSALVRDDAYHLDGRTVNLSTRARLHGAGDLVIAGFVIEGRPRAVLIRAVGPTLARFGVGDALPDPFLSVVSSGFVFTLNDNWSDSPDAAQIAAVAARVGAFPLGEGSLDAARLLVLQPGAYTVHVAAAGPHLEGTILVEVYTVPEDERARHHDSASGMTTPAARSMRRRSAARPVSPEGSMPSATTRSASRSGPACCIREPVRWLAR